MVGLNFVSFHLVSSDDLTDLDEDFEPPLKNTKRKKQTKSSSLPPKKPRRKDELMTSPILASSLSLSTPEVSEDEQSSQITTRQALSKPKKRAVNRGDKVISAKDLYEAVSVGKSDLMLIIDDWLDYYKQSREPGFLVLINFIVQCCGCPGVVTEAMLDNMQNADIITTLTKKFDQSSASYPLSGTGASPKRFRAGLCEFARILVNSCQNSLIYDDYLFPSLLSLLTGLSDSQVRAFRHTSTLLAMKLMSGMAKVVVAVSIQLQTVRRRYDLECGKNMEDQDSERLEDFKTVIKELLENKEELSSMMKATFRGIFVHRYRDQQVEIRGLCVEELGVWVKLNPECYLNDGCLKYLGWMLNDKQSVVRLHCVRSLQGLYEEQEFIGRMELFTSMFKNRLLNMIMDKDSEVAVEVVKLLLQIHEAMDEEGLQEEECAHIYPLVYNANRSLASAAGLFLYKKLKRMIGNENETDMNFNFIQILINFHIKSEFKEHATYLVDSLWGAASSELKDWECMTNLLLQESGLMDEEEGVLIDLMICSIRRAVEATPPLGRISFKKSLSMKERKTQEQDRSRITAHFIPILGLLLAKYSADTGTVRLLLQMPLYFDLDLYGNSQRTEKHLDQLLSQICRIVEKHTDNAVLGACTKLVNTLCSNSHAFSSRSNLVFSQLLDNLTEHFNSCYSDLEQDPTVDVFSAAMALKRIAALVSGTNLSSGRLFDSCMELLKSRMESRYLDEELVVAALKCSAFHLMWAKVNLLPLPSQVDMKWLKKKVQSFCRICETCLSLGQAEIRDQAFELLCDLLILYSRISVHSDPALENLYHVPSNSLRAEMAAFVVDYVLSDTDDDELEDQQEEQLRLLEKKRKQLAGFSKLVIYGVFDITAATDIFKHYNKNFKDFGDIIKETINKTKLINPILSARTLCLSMQQLYSEMLTEELSRRDTDEIRDLARKLTMTFGNDLQQAHKPLLALHMSGILFAFKGPREEGEEQHPNLAFFEILSECNFKLVPKDKARLVTFLKSSCPTDVLLSSKPVCMYQRSLEGTSAQVRETGVGLQTVSATKRRKTKPQGSVDRSKKESMSDNSHVPSQLSSPIYTSTGRKEIPTETRLRQAVILESDVDNSLPDLDSEEEFSSGLIQTFQITGTRYDFYEEVELNHRLEMIAEGDPEQEEAECDECESLPSLVMDVIPDGPGRSRWAR
nr:cohesin subunit SA-1-like [Nerophis lumbriciformis]